MCELFGLSSDKAIHLNEYLSVLFSHGNMHPHGWGIAFFEDNNVSVEKEPVCSVESSYLKRRLRSEICEDKLIAHIRLATKGVEEYDNTHPFVKEDISGRKWTLAHNGTIFSGDMLRPYIHHQKGTTDSERVILCLIDRINKETLLLGRPLNELERFSVVDKLVCELSKDNKLNLLIYDGYQLMVHTNVEETLHFNRFGNTIIFSTTALNHSSWSDVKLNTLISYRDGLEITFGTTHDNIFYEDPEQMKLLFYDYSML